MRGMNVNGGEDPEQNRSVGSTQDDAYEKHHHKSPFGYYNKGFKESTGPPTAVLPEGKLKQKWEKRRPNTTMEGKAAETRPKNVAVYFYIKIN